MSNFHLNHFNSFSCKVIAALLIILLQDGAIQGIIIFLQRFVLLQFSVTRNYSFYPQLN